MIKMLKMIMPGTVLVAPNAFKGSLRASEAAALAARGIRRVLPGAALDLMPVSDGGDGLMEVLLGRFGGRRIDRAVTGPLGRRRRASYALLSDGRTAVVEMAQASGIAGVPKGGLDPLKATTFGTGELIRDALRRGRRRILVGLGGSATSDGGAGMAAALGGRLLDEGGRPLPPGAEPLKDLARIDLRGLRRLLGRAEVLAISDVSNPLLGPRGAARVYGPQKGATPSMVRVIERSLSRYAQVLRRASGREVARSPGSGAAGGLGAGLLGFLRARIVPGADWVLDELGADERIAGADWVLTGEGRADLQSLHGKAPLVLARRARAAGRPVLLLCGQLEEALGRRLRRLGVIATEELRRPREPVAATIRSTRRRFPAAAARLITTGASH